METNCGFKDIPGGATGSLLLVVYGPTLAVDIGFDQNFKPGPPLQIPVPAMKGIIALVDTGASECCIDSMLAAQLALPIVDKRPVSGIHGARIVNMHLAQVHVPSLNYTMYGAFAGVDLTAGGQVHMALLGRNLLSIVKMVYDGPTGQVIISR